MSDTATKAEAGYLAPLQRDRCSTCKNRQMHSNDRDGPWERWWLACRLHGIKKVAGGGICSSYQADKVSTPPPAVTNPTPDLFANLTEEPHP